MVRKITYTVKATGVEPATVQFGGVQSEHRATKLVFNIENELRNSLNSHENLESKLKYRFDVYDGAGGINKTDVYSLASKVEYLLEERDTRYGGTVKVVLVITLVKGKSTEMELVSFPVSLRLKIAPMVAKMMVIITNH